MSTGTHTLETPWPGFLDRLDSDPRGAFRDFYQLTWSLMKASPPRVLARVPEADREDLIQDIVLHCCRDDFRVLRTYRNRRKAFAAWLLFVARNKILDHVTAKRNAPPLPLHEEDDTSSIRVVDVGPSPERGVDSRRVLEIVRSVLREMGEVCRILLQGAAEGYTPRELVQLLGWPEEDNKKASDSLRYCRRKLRAAVLEHGVPDEMLRATS